MANPLLIDHLSEIVPKEDVVICAALWDEDGVKIDFNLGSICSETTRYGVLRVLPVGVEIDSAF